MRNNYFDDKDKLFNQPGNRLKFTGGPGANKFDGFKSKGAFNFKSQGIADGLISARPAYVDRDDPNFNQNFNAEKQKTVVTEVLKVDYSELFG